MTRPLRRRSPLRASGLTLSCRGPTLLRGLSFELRSDRVLVVTGASGVGKTTLLRAIAGTAAEAIAAAAVERSGRLGYVFQEPGAAPTALAQAGHRVAALDLRGFGGSDRPPSGYDLVTLAQDLAAVVRSLGHERAVVVGAGL
ncbi:MAG: alpha/beta fold hydrolase, partial [Propionibacterium acidifaciens]|uniref:alpha/beta fold hydrolase n=1 Tax=Propionibacterium acidifaciens TaxID=556499 RepID=UPI003614A7B9